MLYNESPMKGNIMIKKFKNLDPMTKRTIVTCAVQITILAAMTVAAVKLDKTLKIENEN